MLSNYPLHILKVARTDLYKTRAIIKPNASEKDLKVVDEKIQQLNISIKLLMLPMHYISNTKLNSKQTAPYPKRLELTKSFVKILLSEGRSKVEIARLFDTTVYYVDKTLNDGKTPYTLNKIAS